MHKILGKPEDLLTEQNTQSWWKKLPLACTLHCQSASNCPHLLPSLLAPQYPSIILIFSYLTIIAYTQLISEHAFPTVRDEQSFCKITIRDLADLHQIIF